MRVVDWRGLEASALAPAIARAQARWLRELGWDTRASWIEVERARVGWGLPGLAALDARGIVQGLTFFHARAGRFDLGGVYGESDAARDALLRAAIDVAAHSGARELAAFVHLESSALQAVFTGQGFAIEQCDYLSADLARERPAPTANEHADLQWRAWSPGAHDACADLLLASYDDAAARRFVAEVDHDGWAAYLDALVRFPACGRFLPEASVLAYDADRLVGALLLTDLGPATAHVAQLAVHPEQRRRGVAAHLLDRAMQRAQAIGSARVTLLVSRGNTSAQQLYASRSFAATGMFLAGSRRFDVRSERPMRRAG